MLTELNLYACPVTKVKEYRVKVIGMLPELEKLDGVEREGEEEEEGSEEEQEESEEAEDWNEEEKGSCSEEDEKTTKINAFSQKHRFSRIKNSSKSSLNFTKVHFCY